MTNKLKLLIQPILLILVGLLLAFFFYPKVQPLSTVNLENDRSEILHTADSIVSKMGIAPEGYLSYTRLLQSAPLLRQIQTEMGLEKSNQVLKEGLSALVYDVRWIKKDAQKIFSGNEEREKIAKALVGDFSLQLDQNLALTKLEIELADSIDFPIIAKSEALRISNNFLDQFCPIKNLSLDTTSKRSFDNPDAITMSLQQAEIDTSYVVIREEERAEFVINYSGEEPTTRNKIDVRIKTKGTNIVSYEVDYIVPEKYNKPNGFWSSEIIKAVIYVIFFITIIIFAFKRFRDFEIGFQAALIFGILAFVNFAIFIYFQSQMEFEPQLLLAMFLGGLFIGGGVFITFAVGESMGREVFNEKFTTFDLKFKGHLFHSRIGFAILNSLGFGIFILGAWLFFVYLLNQVIDFNILPISDDGFFLNSKLPVISLISTALQSNLFEITIYFMFVGAILYNRTNSALLFIAVIGILFAFIRESNISPGYIELISQLPIGLLLAYVFYKYDVATTLLSLLIFTILQNSFMLFTGSYIPDSGLYLFTIGAILLLLGMIAVFTKDKISNLDEIKPAFVQHINERQRMQRQLEIARDVQMSFLPAKTPTFNNLDIAAHCLPAFEVGGDYYDFVKISDTKLGIAIGDVSGKGTQAAFYMTLTKGFLKALGKSFDSPAQVLTKMNELFYENVERGHFISMIYAIFDVELNQLQIARAGHNPIIIKAAGKDTCDIYKPAGLALGLENGVVFSRTIKDEIIPISEGDQIIFYTDGFTEAMNNKKEEFGEQSLINLIAAKKEKTASDLLMNITNEVNKFIGKEKPHDDMTMVCIRIK